MTPWKRFRWWLRYHRGQAAGGAVAIIFAFALLGAGIIIESSSGGSVRNASIGLAPDPSPNTVVSTTTTSTTLAPVTTVPPTTVPPTTAPPLTTTTAPPATVQTAPPTTAPANRTVQGSFTFDWSFADPNDVLAGCEGTSTSVPNYYQIEVQNGSGAVIALGTYGPGKYNRSDANGITDVNCSYTYSVSLPTSPIYTFSVLEQPFGETPTQLNAQTISLQALESNGPPALYVQSIL